MEKCLYPFDAFLTGNKTKTGKDEYYLDLNRNAEKHKLLVSKKRDLKINPKRKDCYEIKDGNIWLINSVQVPCGQCPACQINKASEWATRLYLEAKKHKYYYFITLTYNEEALKTDRDFKKDIQLFMKRIRKKLDLKDIKYFANFELGEHTKRPHWHMIMYFDKEFKDKLTWLKKTGENNYYSSEKIQEAWRNGYDVTCISHKPDGALKYVSSYVCKKAGDKTGIHLQSKGLGIAEKKEIHQASYILVDSNRKKIPKYCKKKIEKSNEDLYNEIQNKAREYILREYNRRDQTNDLTKEEYAQEMAIRVIETYANKTKKKI